MIDSIGIHRSVSSVFPARDLQSSLADVDREVRVVSEMSTDLDTVDMLVTLDYDDAFLNGDIRWIHSIQSGVDRFPVSDLRERDVILTSSAGIHRECVAETVLGYMLHFAHGFDVFVRQQADSDWRRPPSGDLTTLADATVAVVGTGTLGRGVADFAGRIGMRAVGVNRSGTSEPDFDRVYPTSELADVLAVGDFVVLAVPLTDETDGLIGDDELERIGADSYLVNVSRGDVVDEDALDRALETGAIAGAAIDVASTEPLPETSPLWDRENVLITPHIAGVWDGYYRAVGDLVRQNLDNFHNDDALVNREV